ncbi:MAG: homoserine dehydrogenase [Candidatus Methylomirabilales bacterium]
MKTINIGILGLGTVGTGVVDLLMRKGADLQHRIGARLEIRKIALREPERPRTVTVDQSLLTTDAHEILKDPAVHIVVELIGGIKEAKEFSLEALRQGKHLVTANKALLATHGREIYASAARHKREVGFEASVCAGVPVIRALREGLVGNRITCLMGIVNGTSNYILTKMSEQGRPFAEVLAEAQARGYAEADPTLDVSGWDTAHKLQILVSIAYGSHIPLDRLAVEGIAEVHPSDIEYAHELGYRVKLLAIAKESDGELEVRVHPTLIPEDHLLASVRGVYNGIYVVGDAAGPQMYYGRGAGQMPTASAVLSDIVEIARNIVDGRPSRTSVLTGSERSSEQGLRDITAVRTRYYLRFTAVDRPGVLSRISGILGDHRISIASVIQKGRAERESVPLIMMTHEALEGGMRQALEGIARLDVVTGRTVCLRVEES